MVTAAVRPRRVRTSSCMVPYRRPSRCCRAQRRGDLKLIERLSDRAPLRGNRQSTHLHAYRSDVLLLGAGRKNPFHPVLLPRLPIIVVVRVSPPSHLPRRPSGLGTTRGFSPRFSASSCFTFTRRNKLIYIPQVASAQNPQQQICPGAPSCASAGGCAAAHLAPLTCWRAPPLRDGGLHIQARHRGVPPGSSTLRRHEAAAASAACQPRQGQHVRRSRRHHPL